MASSGSADEDFQSRVAKIFGSLPFSRPSSSKFSTSSSAPASRQQSGSVWTLSDTEVEKREWKRDSYDRDEIPCASSFDELLKQQKPSEDDLKDIDCGEDFDGVWSIRASMGLDRTLDDEAEEDEYDKVALGEENDGEGCGRIRDPRANYVAARIRLKEDEIEANKFNTSASQPSESKEPHAEESSEAMPRKPILKRKENSSDSEARTSKRVRFDSVPEETLKKPEDTCSASASSKIVSHQGKSGARVPDYLLNPSSYTRYSFDPSCELDVESPTGEYMDTPNAVEGLKNPESESFPKVSFIPQNKTKDVSEDSSNCNETKPIVAGELAEEERPSATEDGDTEIRESESCTSFQSKGRQYRAKLSLDETDV
ncbi:putative tumor suppressing sub-chromosomal transferable candidate 4 [Arabidopsis thaliana]|uniref:Uncharacterized protein At5g13310 n=4 Tax=Arabidopsis TaxID=3701 RepID=Q9LYU5_ARATH|nr:uncharacterized protein AT5G13310 [Arabidopsis thaliana]NP_196835.1 uncharacterized protein AT5G13310 [Arabidopsis thaliana]KAG7602103.1 hypothetical protein ISN45_At05g012090 [Arabidopsis thaliana x Arabidopsis arenosa]KAG7609054.1 hypothetical protein ISN44_As05g012050 [Arabidopsis suecica]AAM65158.1 unknown [Arabidopsis thaliana]AAO41996.1 unknown protein [Arabidopsis thaliana]AAO50579.1 unknown protein [Arabidopsis thaliana]|eukprot:NP_001331631.1 hypothetical protein AT5G13310 [Arabidopsis thaliana]